MASAISTHTFLCSSTQRRRSTSSFILTSTLVLSTKPTNFILSTSTPQLGLGLFSAPWTGLKQVGFSIRSKSVRIGRRGRYRGKFYASLFGVGAPEALVIGVVALLVFGPKGLAEVARNLGKTLRAFQPTIRELQDVSREFKSTLEREIGLDDLPPSTQNTSTSSISRSSSSSSLSSAESENPNAALDPTLREDG